MTNPDERERRDALWIQDLKPGEWFLWGDEERALLLLDEVDPPHRLALDTTTWRWRRFHPTQPVRRPKPPQGLTPPTPARDGEAGPLWSFNSDDEATEHVEFLFRTYAFEDDAALTEDARGLKRRLRAAARLDEKPDQAGWSLPGHIADLWRQVFALIVCRNGSARDKALVQNFWLAMNKLTGLSKPDAEPEPVEDQAGGVSRQKVIDVLHEYFPLAYRNAEPAAEKILALLGAGGRGSEHCGSEHCQPRSEHSDATVERVAKAINDTLWPKLDHNVAKVCARAALTAARPEKPEDGEGADANQ
jgi:hypothetical protein